MRPALCIIVFCFCIASAAFGTAAENPRTRLWLLEELERSLQNPVDLNRISSMLYGLSKSTDGELKRRTDAALTKVAARLSRIKVHELDCTELVDLLFVTGFVRPGPEFDTTTLDERLNACSQEKTDPFDLAGALFFRCHFTSRDPRETLPGAIEKLESLQRADGGFGFAPGLPGFYLSTHALFALHACDANRKVIRRGQAYLLSILPQIQRSGFLDGLLESLLMLRKMEVPIPAIQTYVEYIRSRTRNDGAICFFDIPGCSPHWHATSLLLEFQHVFSR